MAGDRLLKTESEAGPVEFSPDGKTLTAYCRDMHLRTWDVETGRVVADRRKREDGPATLLDGKHYADRGAAGVVRLWDLTSNTQVQTINGAPPGRVALSPDGRHLAVAANTDTSVRLWNAATGERRHVLADGLGGAASLVFSPDGETLVSANYDNDIRIWRTRSGELVRKMEEMTGAMFAAEFTPDGRYLVMAGLDQTVYVFDAKTWQLTRKLAGHGETISALAISPDSKLVATGGFDVITTQNPVKVVFWELATGRVIRTAKAPHRVMALAFSPDGKWAAMTAGAKEIALLAVGA